MFDCLILEIVYKIFYIFFSSPPRMLHSCARSSTPSDYSSKQLLLSPVTTPSKVITDSNYVGSFSDMEGFHVLEMKSECNENLSIKYVKIYLTVFMYIVYV